MVPIKKNGRRVIRQILTVGIIYCIYFKRFSTVFYNFQKTAAALFAGTRVEKS